MGCTCARLWLATLVVLAAACGAEADGPTQSSAPPGISMSPSTEPTACCTVQDGRYQLSSLTIDGTGVEGWSIGHNRVAELVVAGTSWYFQAQNRFDTTVTAENGSMVVVPGMITAAATDDDWLLRMGELNSYTVDGDTLVLAGPTVTSTWTSAGAVTTTEPSNATVASTAPESALSGLDRQLIFAAAVASQTAGFQPREEFPEVRIDVIDTIGLPRPNHYESHMLRFTGGEPFSEAQRTAIVEELDPLPVLFVPPTVYEDPYYVSFDGVAKGNVVLSFGQPVEVEGEYRIITGVWCGPVCGGGGEQQLEQLEDGTWRVTGPVGPQWVS